MIKSQMLMGDIEVEYDNMPALSLELAFSKVREQLKSAKAHRETIRLVKSVPLHIMFLCGSSSLQYLHRMF
jgi:hypothetical protein